jgi:hypothetical protein
MHTFVLSLWEFVICPGILIYNLIMSYYHRQGIFAEFEIVKFCLTHVLSRYSVTKAFIANIEPYSHVTTVAYTSADISETTNSVGYF